MATSESQQQAALKRLYELANQEIRAALALVDIGDAAAVADVIYTYLPVIAERYGLAAGALAADWYDELREASAVPGRFKAITATLPDMGRYESMARWVSDKADIEALVAGGAQRIIANMHRQTVMGSAFADPQSAGWARFARGAETCGFCFMLVSRGAVYSDATAKFGAHDDCDCGAGPVWKGDRHIVDAYRKSAKRRTESTTKADNARAREWVAENL